MSTTSTPEEQAISEAQNLLRRGEGLPALQRLQEAVAASPKHHDLQLNLAMARRTLGDLEGAIAALDAALAIDPYSFLALLSKGSVLEQMGYHRGAAEVYRNALHIAPHAGEVPAGLQKPLAHAREVIETQAKALASHLHSTLAPYRQKQDNDSQGGETMARFLESVDILAGVKKVHSAEPLQFHYPRLPAIPFFPRESFPWMDTLEAGTDVIRSELVALLEQGLPGFKPYVQYAPGTPENQFAPLNHSNQWSSLWLWKAGAEQPEAMASFPQTTALLRELPLCDEPGFAPTALFSALAPRTRIPPHTGSTNTRLLVHLPLVLPGPAGFRVGNEVRHWELGKAWAFDDTIEHEAWNDADETRVIMIFDIWNPLLSSAEQELVSALMATHRDWLNAKGD
jgi:aspartyl/asparaginyl beta-hydroxylase (cupin superfamily)